jgi:hypothetical protein
MSRSRFRIPAALFAIACCGCERSAPPPAQPPALPLRTQATASDPDADDEGLRAALRQLRDRFACNAVSGCPAHAVIAGYGWNAVPHLQQTFDRAPLQSSYRARTVRLLAEARHPGNEAMFAHVLDDRDPEVRGHAAVGLAWLGARRHELAVRALAGDDSGPWFAPGRLGALFALHVWGDPSAHSAYLRALDALSDQNLAAHAIAFGVALCREPQGPDCTAHYPHLARHPGFLGRRAVVDAMVAAPQPKYVPALVELTADPVRSLADKAQRALVQMSGGPERPTTAWRQWAADTALAPTPAVP